MTESPIPPVDPRDRRRYPRTAVLWPGRIAAEGAKADCLVLNLSAGGAKIRTAGPVGLDAKLTVSIGQFGEFCGTVVWKAKDLLGVRFTDDAIEVGERLGATLPRCWLDEALV
jgi:hypothetical protein